MRRQIIVSLIQFLLVLLIQLAISEPLTQLHFVHGSCRKSSEVNSTSTYSSNILSVLSNLTSLSTISKFSHFSSGAGADLVSGLFLCRPDLSFEACTECVTAGAAVFRIDCLDQKEAILWYEECMLRYSNHTLLATEETKPFAWFHSTLNVSRTDLFPDLLNHTLEVLITKAASASNPLRYATANTSFTLFEGLYGLAVCTPDITPLQCEHCLRNATAVVPSCCGEFSLWTMIFLPSCQLRYDTAPFIISPPSPPPPPPLTAAP